MNKSYSASTISNTPCILLIQRGLSDFWINHSQKPLEKQIFQQFWKRLPAPQTTFMKF